jgi:Rrf2 family protein
MKLQALSIRKLTMKLSTKSRYGTRLMLDLAKHYGDGYIQLKDIAAREGISLKYLEQIMIQLRKAKLVESVRGAGGGYRLASPPEDISVGQIVALLEGGAGLIDCGAKPDTCRRSKRCATRNLWMETAEVMYDKLNRTTLLDLILSNKEV